MNKIQLSANTFHLTEVFDKSLLNDIVEYADTFVPDSTRESYDAPHLSASIDGARREVIHLTKGKMLSEIINCFPEIGQQKFSVEFWRDYLGYRNGRHVDARHVKNIIVVYLDGSGGNNMGTAVYEDKTYIAEYKLNTGIILLNSNQVEHQMIGTVDNTPYRKILYINWG